MPKLGYFPPDHFNEEVLPPNKMKRLALQAFAKGNTNNFDFLNVEVSFTNSFNTWTHPFRLRVSVPVNH